MKVRCSFCRRIIGGYIPKGGDGTVSRPYPHKINQPGQIMKNDLCPGRFQDAEIVVEEQDETRAVS